MNQNDTLSSTILIVDDKLENINTLIALLQGAGYRLLIAQNGTEALKRVRYGNPDLILLDILMPDMDGFEVCRNLKQNESTQHIPVIFMTALTEISDKIKGFEAGAVDYISKPFQQEEVLARIKTHVTITLLQKQKESINQILEQSIKERTIELAEANQILREEIQERKCIEERLRKQETLLKEQNEEYSTLNEELNERNRHIQKMNEELRFAKEKAEESDRLKTSFLGNMSHEIRTPMNAIKGFSELLNQPDLSHERRQKFINTINERTDDLLQIINDILDISRIEAHEMTLIESESKLSTLFAEIDEFIESRTDFFEGKLIEFKKNIQVKETENNIRIDFMRLKQVILNLISNAFKFTSRGLIELGCQSKGNQLFFYVKDTGIGISEEKQAVIFNRFRQADDTFLTRKYGGLGLGLSISKGLVELMKGRIWVESYIDKGSIFYFTVPFHPSQKNLTIPVLKDLDWSEKTILIVEDDAYNADYILELLSVTNAKCEHVSSGLRAMEYVKANPKIDLIMMDIRLPDINGFELTQQIKTLNPNQLVIAQTAYAGSEDRTKCLLAGCNDFIAKPIVKEKLLKLIQLYFEKKR